LQAILAAASTARLPLVAANDVHYHVPARRRLQDVLTAIRHGCTVAELGRRRFPNGERHLKPVAELQEIFALAPGAIERTVEIADRCEFSLDQLRYEYPEELCPAGLTPLEHLTRLTWEGARQRYPLGQPEKVVRLIEYELALIAEMHYEAYFLTVWDLVRFANERRILCQGRGSAANSAVCYCLGITAVNPDQIDVLFERFISKDRGEAPDIDVDFEHERREEVLQYLYTKYGRERAGMTAEVITYQMRSAVRDVGKALGLSPDHIDNLAKAMDHRHDEEKTRQRFREAGFPPDAPLARALVELVEEILHFPRHLSQHTGGMVMTQGPLCELVPIENAAMADRTVVEWDKNDLDALGILKVDCLALGMLTAIRKAFDFIERHYHRPLTLATVPPEDPAVYDMIDKADTIGVFQIESRAQMSMLPRLRPREFYDLVIEVAIVRPGPIQGDMVHPYLRRRSGKEPVDYPDERVRDVLGRTLGVPIFQEQAMRLVVVAAGFTPGEADQFRRAMGAWRRRGVMEQFRQKMLAGMLGNGYSPEFAQRVYRQIQGFGEYGFPESHAASFALLVYVSAWLKHHYPDAFAAALINSQPMGFYAPAQLIGDARKHGVEVRPIDVNFSDWDCTLEDRRAGDVSPPREGAPAEDSGFAGGSAPRGTNVPRSPALRLGFRLIRGFSQRFADVLMQARQSGPFVSFDDLKRRTGLRSAALQRLARADAFRSLGLERRPALWRALPDPASLPLFDACADEEVPASLPKMSPLSEVLSDYGHAGLTLRDHPISFLRKMLDDRHVRAAAKLGALASGKWVKVAGVVLLRQRPGTAKGITFVTLEDETGVVNLIIRQEVWERYRRAARAAVVMLAHGRLQREGDIIHVLVARIEDISDHIGTMAVHSRDFR
jgi:error-prone DNA polymerase